MNEDMKKLKEEIENLRKENRRLSIENSNV